ncbi:RNA polymerase sigma-70 factor [Actinoallomurus rhizosphaericola]|uniref:RNA polymerase sigma-70 factor n=1 Tax=Actinoallomurus rhizosphaericola TaxID=2952536 RepID=UPI002093E3C9|nr:RNA polymerase sigma-70 factor [Actinoallomurus rhizosphaericola]MCO5996237.1 RNA polymerase sigma-70 factor [Actinoallomurus rhizosphaericola]
MDKLAEFTENRARLFGLAYRLLGEATEAEDVLQDAYLRWETSGPVDVPAAWLTTVVTNLCLSRLGSARARRERYVGPWLPEPVFTEDGRLGPLETVEQRESISLGVLMLLERLSPPERAAFVLREAFGYRHAEIADVLGVDEAHARQLYRRARAHVSEPRRRFAPSTAHREEIVLRFLAAATEGDLAGLEKLLAEDVVAWSDGGGKVTAARRPVVGPSQVARFFVGLAAQPRIAGMDIAIRTVNGEPALVLYEAGELCMIVSFDVAGDRVTAVNAVLNPDKLAYAAAQER